MADLRLDKVTVMADRAPLVDQCSLPAGAGEFIAVVGENGAGKSTLLRAIAGYVPISAGSCTLDGVDIASLPTTERARKIAWLPQTMPVAWPIRVSDAVALGRFPHGAAPWRLAQNDRIAIERALKACDLMGLRDRSTATLSGGELARVHIARALASEAPLLLADEPVAALDPRHQLAVLQLFRASVDRGGCAIVILHDLALAARFADRIIGMKGGRIVVDDTPQKAITAEWIDQLFGVTAVIDHSAGWPRPMLG